MAGIVDFDVLDGMEEFLWAGRAIGLKTVVGLESRVFISELADKVINSPNEPGISYFMAGGGCYKLPQPGSEAAEILSRMRRMAKQRTAEIANRVNDYLGEVRIDYERDVIPLTPSGNATERHLLMAYDARARHVIGGSPGALAGFWSSKLGTSAAEMEALIDNMPAFHELLRAKLMKYGSVGYVTPDKDSFPSIESAVVMIRGIDAVPTCTWLDGMSPGEQDPIELLELMQSKGIGGVNIIPDRNWNIKNAEEKAMKIRNLGRIIEACRKLDLPIFVGTEMNKTGQPFVDDFHAPELAPYVEDFLAGARWAWERRRQDLNFEFEIRVGKTMSGRRSIPNSKFKSVPRVQHACSQQLDWSPHTNPHNNPPSPTLSYSLTTAALSSLAQLPQLWGFEECFHARKRPSDLHFLHYIS